MPPETIIGHIPSTLMPVLARHWAMLARDDQWPPGGDWSIWLIMGGRGAGKTRTGAEWIRACALGLPPFAEGPARRLALIGETMADARAVMIEGVSGLLSVHSPQERPHYEPSRRLLTWPNGSVAQVFSADEPDSLRGPQFDAAWSDELAKWKRGEAAWDNLQFALRLGDKPRQIVTTTPRPNAVLKRLLSDPRCVVSRASTFDNAFNLAAPFLEAVTRRYAGTRLGRQELEGEIVEDREGALFSRDLIEAARIAVPPALRRIVVAVDPPASSGKRADACGIVAAGIDEAGIVHVLEDATLERARPSVWAAAALAAFARHQADALVAEVNQGGEMVASVLREVDPAVPVTSVRATRGKYLRAEPVAQAFEQGRIRLVGSFPALEDEMCDFGPDGLSNGRSPDRLDAFVWAVSSLLAGSRTGPRLRRL